MGSESNWIFLRGLMRESRHWHNFPDELKEQIPGAHIHLIDGPGNGMNFDRTTPLRISRMTDDIRLQYTRRAPNRDLPTFLFSISMGSMIAVDWLSRYSENIAGAVLINTSFSSLSPVFRRLRPDATIKGFDILRSPTGPIKERKILDLTTNLVQNKDELAHEFSTYGAEYPVSARSGLRQLAAASMFRLPKVRPNVPILVLTGERDRMVDPRCSHALVREWNTDFAYHPTAGHDLTLDAPDWVATKVKHWLEKMALD